MNGVEKATPADTLQAALDIQILGGAFGGGIMVAATSKDKSAVRIIDIELRLVLLDKEHFEIGRDGGVIPFTLFRNMPVEIGTDADWMRVDPVTRVIEETFAVTVEENATGEDRTGIILIKSGADGPQVAGFIGRWPRARPRSGPCAYHRLSTQAAHGRRPRQIRSAKPAAARRRAPLSIGTHRMTQHQGGRRVPRRHLTKSAEKSTSATKATTATKKATTKAAAKPAAKKTATKTTAKAATKKGKASQK